MHRLFGENRDGEMKGGGGGVNNGEAVAGVQGN